MKRSKCQFNRGGCCYALACYSSEKCGAKDKRGVPKYVGLDKALKNNTTRAR
jgi:hypothetical protein